MAQTENLNQNISMDDNSNDLSNINIKKIDDNSYHPFISNTTSKKTNRVLYIEIENPDSNEKETLTITPYGLNGSLRKGIPSERTEIITYFGHQIDSERIDVDYILPQSKAFETFASDYDKKSDKKNEGKFFKIYFNKKYNKYFLQDLGLGYGTFIKVDNEFLIKENTIINIGDSYMVFSYFFPRELIDDKRNTNAMTENGQEIYIKIYSEKTKYDPIILQHDSKQFFKVGRLENNDVYIKDKMLSRVHCMLRHTDKGWLIKDGNELGQKSTNGTWVFAYEEMPIENGMKFKSNSCNFTCYYES